MQIAAQRDTDAAAQANVLPLDFERRSDFQLNPFGEAERLCLAGELRQEDGKFIPAGACKELALSHASLEAGGHFY